MSDIVTTTGQSIGNYPNYKEGKTAAEQATFVATAKIPLAGKYNESDESMETKSVMLSELGGGLPETTGKQGQVLTVNSSEEAVWDAVPSVVPPDSYNPFAGMVGKSKGDTIKGIVYSYTATVDEVTSGQVSAWHYNGTWGTIAGSI